MHLPLLYRGTQTTFENKVNILKKFPFIHLFILCKPCGPSMPLGPEAGAPVRLCSKTAFSSHLYHSKQQESRRSENDGCIPPFQVIWGCCAHCVKIYGQ